MSHAPFNTTQHGLPMPNAGLASRRGGQGIKPLSFDAVKAQNNLDNGVPTPRTSRSHLLANLRTAPKSATVGNFNNGPASPTVAAPQGRNRNSMIPGMYDSANLYNGPKTSLPRYGASQQQVPQVPQVQQQQIPQAPAYNAATGYGQPQYMADQILAPQLDGLDGGHIDPDLQAQLLYNGAFLRDQQERLQNQIRMLQQAAQQFQGLSINGQPQMMQQQGYQSVYQQQIQNLQSMMTPAQPNLYVGYDQNTGQQMLFVDQSQQVQLQAQLNSQYMNNQAQLYAALQQQQQQQQAAAPRVQVSPPPEPRNNNNNNNRSSTPPRRFDSPSEAATVPLPPPSANAFRRGHKKSPSLANNSNNNSKNTLTISTSDESPKTGGLKTSTVPLTPLTSGYGPGQARAGEHPVRQPRNPPSLDELKSKPTAKHDGSKNFVTRTRRSAVANLARAGLERRKEARSSGSVSPISESTEEMIETPMTDNDSDSGRSGSGSLIEREDAECSLPSSRTSTGSWGAIGSDRPSSRQKLDRRNTDSAASSDNESARESGSFASLLKNSTRRMKADSVEGQRKAAMLVLTSADKRKVAV